MPRRGGGDDLRHVRERSLEGKSWAEIGDALGVSRQAAWQLYNQELNRAVALVRKLSGMSESDTLALASEELSSVRSRRRRRRGRSSTRTSSSPLLV